ncbi:MAG: VCBS repeat-containing protein, partial [Planctomycetaceae bacterium]|nr:VCBS repeat-containing protein [Planctomycetaceae bacterium]
MPRTSQILFRRRMLIRLFCLCLIMVPGLSGAAHEPHSAENRTLDEFRRIALTDVYYSEGASAGDINGDGLADLVYGPHWYAGPTFERAAEIYPAAPQNRNGYSDHFFHWVFDFDGDGHQDVLTAGFPGTPGYVYRNPGPKNLDELWERFTVADQVSNEAP